MFIMHVLVELTGAEIDFAFVQSRWGTPFWRIYDLLLLVLAFVHGVERRARRDRPTTSPTARARSLAHRRSCSCSPAIWLVLGIAVIVFFDPNTAPPTGPFS